MNVEQTVNVCRLNAKSDLVKSILASTTFSDSKDVVAKLIVEQNNEVKERQVLAFRTCGSNFSRNFRDSFRGHSNYNPSRNFTGYMNRFSSGNGNQRYRPTNGYTHQSVSNNNRFNNNRVSNRNNTNNSRSSNNRGRNANIRALNAHAPQERTLGEQELDN
ncbi:PREDICTED: uncharacterized protein DDB_G0283697-like [Rhagoletis zephyria]|uniref:uncharacterized protein DDB_G0283697-like n=1 Tax=Rhagoletis zephyria TaxID=28612 RepID=UPI0008114B92|nr:PREDICTED: uncharacterized protein DDB_G0283697-like [Rhagoletis zephyria]